MRGYLIRQLWHYNVNALMRMRYGEDIICKSISHFTETYCSFRDHLSLLIQTVLIGIETKQNWCLLEGQRRKKTRKKINVEFESGARPGVGWGLGVVGEAPCTGRLFILVYRRLLSGNSEFL